MGIPPHRYHINDETIPHIQNTANLNDEVPILPILQGRTDPAYLATLPSPI